MKPKFTATSFITALLLMVTCNVAFPQSAAINATGAAAAASSIFDISSTTKGLLIPRMTTTERNAIGSPATGLMIWNTTDSTINEYRGASGWYSFAHTTGTETIAGAKTFSNDITPTGRIIVPMGEIDYFNTTGTTITISGLSDGTNNFSAVNPASALSAGVYEFTNGGANDGTLKYTGATTKMFHMAITVSGTPQTSSDVFVFAVYKNGVIVNSSKVLGSSSGTQFSSLHVMLELMTNDKVQLRIGNLTRSSNGNFVVKSLNFFAMGM